MKQIRYVNDPNSSEIVHALLPVDFCETDQFPNKIVLHIVTDQPLPTMFTIKQLKSL